MNKAFLFLLLPVFFGCAEPEKAIRGKLEFILQDDLKAIVAEMRKKDTASVLEKPYYRIAQYETFEKKLTFNRKVVVHFYYLRSIQMMQVRKYRYNPVMKQWQRYYKALEYNLS